MNWKLLLHKAGEYYYMEFLMIFTSLAVVVLFACVHKKRTPYVILTILAAVSFCQTAFIDYCVTASIHSPWRANMYKNSLYPYICIELICCLLFLRQTIKSIAAKRTMLTFVLLFPIYTMTYWYFDADNPYFPLEISITESFIIIISCLYFFYELFIKTDNKRPFEEPAVWAAFGMLLLFSSIIPLFIFYGYMKKVSLPLAKHLYSINFIAYSILFISFSVSIIHNNLKNRL